VKVKSNKRKKTWLVQHIDYEEVDVPSIVPAPEISDISVVSEDTHEEKPKEEKPKEEKQKEEKPKDEKIKEEKKVEEQKPAKIKQKGHKKKIS